MCRFEKICKFKSECCPNSNSPYKCNMYNSFTNEILSNGINKKKRLIERTIIFES